MPLDFHPADRRRAQWKALTRRARRGKNAEAFLIQFSLARIGAGESLRILAERLSQWGIETRH